MSLGDFKQGFLFHVLRTICLNFVRFMLNQKPELIVFRSKVKSAKMNPTLNP